MIDREKVVKEYEDYVNSYISLTTSNDYELEMHKAVLALLKEQEPVEPEVEVLNEIDRLYRCQRCHGYLFYDGQKYCDRCGQEVKWDDI